MLCTNLLSATERRVGFTVGVTAFSSTWQGHILVFPHVVTNKGNVYNRSTGKFTAPIDGTYVFFVAVNAYASTHLYLEIVHNGSSKVRTYTSNGANGANGNKHGSTSARQRGLCLGQSAQWTRLLDRVCTHYYLFWFSSCVKTSVVDIQYILTLNFYLKMFELLNPL